MLAQLCYGQKDVRDSFEMEMETVGRRENVFIYIFFNSESIKIHSKFIILIYLFYIVIVASSIK